MLFRRRDCVRKGGETRRETALVKARPSDVTGARAKKDVVFLFPVGNEKRRRTIPDKRKRRNKFHAALAASSTVRRPLCSIINSAETFSSGHCRVRARTKKEREKDAAAGCLSFSPLRIFRAGLPKIGKSPERTGGWVKREQLAENGKEKRRGKPREGKI